MLNIKIRKYTNVQNTQISNITYQASKCKISCKSTYLYSAYLYIYTEFIVIVVRKVVNIEFDANRMNRIAFSDIASQF